jgi:hypothetical protein
MSESWSLPEVELVVADYFAMLWKELAGLPIDKTAHRKALQPRLNGRSHGSIEFKHQNISAVLINFDQPYVNGYKPRQNYQALLEQVVLEYLESDRTLVEAATRSTILNPTSQPVPAFDDVRALMEEPPEPGPQRAAREQGPARPRLGVDFVQRDARNRELGRNGEEWGGVEWVAATRGDGLGYDIESFNRDGSARVIEVKTTGLGKHFPFYVSANELRVSQQRPRDYHLYRVFNFASAPRMYPLTGALDQVCRLEPQSFVARVG